MQPALNILLIEDDQDDFLIIKELLDDIEGCDYSLHCARNGKDGIERLKTEPFDVCLVDYRIDGHSGIDFIAEVTEMNVDVPLILITGSSSREVDLAASEVGAANFVEMKKLTSVGLERAIRYSVNRAARLKIRRVKADLEQSQLEHELRQAVSERQFEVYLQPEIHCEKLEVRKAEALVRWNHPKFGVIGPEHFIDVAERTGLIIGIGNSVVDKICEYSNYLKSIQKDIKLAFNVSTVQIERRDFVDLIEQTLVGRHADPATIEIEITESVAMSDPDLVRAHMKALKRIGVNFAVDDFGTGHSGLATLKDFPFDSIKIDRSFVQTAEKGARNRAIAKTIFYLADVMRLETVAEGIETDGQFAFVRNYGATYAQGFLFSKALPFDDFLQFVHGFDARWESRQFSAAG